MRGYPYPEREATAGNRCRGTDAPARVVLGREEAETTMTGENPQPQSRPLAAAEAVVERLKSRGQRRACAAKTSLDLGLVLRVAGATGLLIGARPPPMSGQNGAVSLWWAGCQGGLIVASITPQGIAGLTGAAGVCGECR